MRVGRKRSFAVAPRTGNEEVDKALEQIKLEQNELRTEIVEGELVRNVRATTSPQTLRVSHRLDRIPVGWVVSSLRGGQPQELYQVDSPQLDRELRLQFVGSTAITFDLWIF